MVVFDKQWFKKHQKSLLVLANTWMGRWFFRIRRDVPKGKRLIEITPDSFTWQESIHGKVYLSTDFRTHDKFAKRLYFGLKPVWDLLHFLDNLLSPLSRFGLRLNFGFDTLTAYSVNTMYMPHNAEVSRANTVEYFNLIRAGQGTYAGTDSMSSLAFLLAGPTTNTFMHLSRSIFTFDTSAIKKDAFIHSTVFSVYNTLFTNELGLTEQQAGLSLVAAAPAKFWDIQPVDYQCFGNTRLADDFLPSGEGYANFTLNQLGRDSIKKEEISGLGIRFAVDTDGGQPPWADYQWTYCAGSFADYDGSGPDPKIVITYLPAIEENISISDDISNTIDKILGESVVMQESPLKSAQKDFLETLLFSGNAEVFYLICLPETFALSEFLSKEINKNLKDGIAISEAQKKTGSRTVSDEIDLTEALNILPVLSQDAADYMPISEKF